MVHVSDPLRLPWTIQVVSLGAMSRSERVGSFLVWVSVLVHTFESSLLQGLCCTWSRWDGTEDGRSIGKQNNREAYGSIFSNPIDPKMLGFFLSIYLSIMDGFIDDPRVHGRLRRFTSLGSEWTAPGAMETRKMEFDHKKENRTIQPNRRDNISTTYHPLEPNTCIERWNGKEHQGGMDDVQRTHSLPSTVSKTVVTVEYSQSPV